MNKTESRMTSPNPAPTQWPEECPLKPCAGVGPLYSGGELETVIQQTNPNNGIQQTNEMIAEIRRRWQAAPILAAALRAIGHLWPEPPNCAAINPEHVGPNDGKSRAILLEGAILTAREALTKVGAL